MSVVMFVILLGSRGESLTSGDFGKASQSRWQPSRVMESLPGGQEEQAFQAQVTFCVKSGWQAKHLGVRGKAGVGGWGIRRTSTSRVGT